MWKQSNRNVKSDVIGRHTSRGEQRFDNRPTPPIATAPCPRCGSSTVRPTIASIRGYYFKCGRCEQLWHSYNEVPRPEPDDQTSGHISIRNVLERRPIMIRDREYTLRLIDITMDVEGGATVTIAVEGKAQPLQLNVTSDLFHDPIALRLRAAYFLRQMTAPTSVSGPRAAHY
jgi:hypothetical protein